MTLIDWREMPLDGAILRERESDESRLVAWLPSGREGDFQRWERIATAARGEIVVEQGLCAAAATIIRARQRIGGLLGKLLHRFGEARRARSFVLPGGESAEQCGEREGDCLLVWPEDPAEGLDEDLVRSRWPEARRHRRLGPRLFLVEGIAARTAAANGPGAPEVALPPQDMSPRKQGEQALADARVSGDRAREVTALTDLGIITLTEGDPRRAIAVLEEGLALARQMGDAAKEHDILGNLGLAALHVQQPARARQLFEGELAHARAVGDVLAEKVAMERMGLAASVLGDPHGALDWYDKALELTRRVGDQHQEASLLWLQGIQLAELDRRDEAIARAQDAVALFTKLGKPQASWYGAYLQKYRMGLFDNSPALAAAGVSGDPAAYLGGSLVASVVAGQPQANPQGTTGPGLLRMALSATRSMAQFAGSGFKTATPDVQRRRLQTCAGCEHHTGLRCKICGCFTAAKSRILQESCPIGKWPA